MTDFARRYFPDLLKKALPADQYEAAGRCWEPEAQVIVSLKDDFHFPQVQECIRQHAAGVVAYAVVPVLNEDTLSVELQFAGQDEAHAFLKAYRKVRLHKPRSKAQGPANKLYNRRMYILPDGREFWLYDKWDGSRRIGKVIAGRNPDGTCMLTNEIVDEDVLRRCPVVPKGKGAVEAQQMSRPGDILPRVRVVHGANDGQFTPLVGETVALARATLAVPFNIPPYAPAFVNGDRVGRDQKLRANDTLEFVLPWGVKGLGDLLTPEDLMSRWRMTEDQYRELLNLGLPTFHLGSGVVRHPELAVDEWCRQRWQQDREPPTQVSGGDRPARWWHPASATPPPSYPFGPLHGTQADLASWLYGDGKPDARRLHGKAASGAVWVRKDHARRYEVWFRTERELTEAKKKQGQTTHEKA